MVSATEGEAMLGEVAERLIGRFPDQYGTSGAEEALRRVARLSEQYSR